MVRWKFGNGINTVFLAIIRIFSYISTSNQLFFFKDRLNSYEGDKNAGNISVEIGSKF